MKKRIVVFWIALCVLFSTGTFIPVSAENEGICGDNLTWSFKNGILTISGKGDMENYSISEDWQANADICKDVPWRSLYNDISHVVINQGVTSIGDAAFSYIGLHSIDIADSVTKIGEEAFMSCEQLNYIKIPDNVTEIGAWAFSYNNKLISVDLPNNLKFIGSAAFNNCFNLKNITMSEGLKSIGNNAFSGCESLININIPNSVEIIGYCAFSGCKSLTDITLPNKLDMIESGVFNYCTNLKNIVIPLKVKIIEKGFIECNKLSNIYYEGSKSDWDKIYIEKIELIDGSYLNIFSDTINFNFNSYAKEEISVVLNGEKIKFDQPPINQNGNLLVPIRKIAESMGKTVLWSDKANAAFIDNTNNALIIPIGETTLYLGDEKPYSTWKTIKTNVPSQVINGRTLVPIRQFAEALGAEVNWIDKYSTATISYNNVESEAMSSSLYDAINMNYYIAHCGDNPFIWYTDNVINPFYDSRNSTVDAITMGLDKPWNVITDLWSGIYGDTNASIIIQETLYDVLNEVPEDENYDLDLNLLKDIKSYSENGLKIFKEIKGFDAEFLKNHKNLKYLNDSLLKVAESDTTGTVFDIFDWTVFSAEEVAYLLSDYSVNISYLDVLEKALDNQGLLDYSMQEAIDDLRVQYADKFTEVVLDIQKEIIDNAFGTAMSTVTGAGYGVGKFVWDKIIFNVTGVNKKGSALKTFYGIYCYNEALDREFSNELVESKTDIDINYIKALINLQKATKKTAINSIADMANWWAKDEVNQSADELEASLNSWSYYIWENTNVVSNGGNNSGGGSSW